MFVATVIDNGGAICLFVAGIFYAQTLHIHGFDTPVRSVNAPAAVVKVTVSGKGRNRFFISARQTFSGMTAFDKKCLNGKTTPGSNQRSRTTNTATVLLPVSNPYSIPCFEDFMDEATRRFEIEKEAKNKAYAFIADRGLFRDFMRYSRNHDNE